ncbi:MAG: nucleoside monophosphate kinase [Candidatus Shapirobacteria bacterium]
MTLNLFIIGPSGCGKSTQAKLIAQKYNLTHLSMGQLLRDEISNSSPLGIEAKGYIDQGKWVPDELAFRVLTTKLESINNSNFIIDGFPRMLNQGELIEQYLASKNQSFSLLILLSVTFEEIMARRTRLGQSFQDASRTDNSAEAVASRQKSYNDTISPIIGHYEQSGKMVVVDGNRTVEPVFADIVTEIEKVK